MGVNALTSRDQVSQRQHAAASPASVCCGISLQLVICFPHHLERLMGPYTSLLRSRMHPVYTVWVGALPQKRVCGQGCGGWRVQDCVSAHRPRCHHAGVLWRLCAAGAPVSMGPRTLLMPGRCPSEPFGIDSVSRLPQSSECPARSGRLLHELGQQLLQATKHI